MRCWVGGEEAEGMCQFCGRAVCKKHTRTRPFLFVVWQDENQERGLAVEDALWCGVCKVHPEPIDTNFLLSRHDKK